MNKILAIAIDEYSDSTITNLNNCTNDISSLIDVLSTGYQFDSFELFTRAEQTTLRFIYEKLNEEFINSLETDNVLLLFAGHGEYNPKLGTSYWLCSDSKKSDVTTWFNIENLFRFFSVSAAKHIALISDNCFSGAIFENYRGGGVSALDGKVSRQALTSGGIEKVSDGNRNSPFNAALIKILKENESDLMSFTSLSEKTILAFDKGRRQTPAYGSLSNAGDKGGSFFFKLKKDDSNFIKTIQIPLEISKEFKIESNFEIPFFNENKYFKNDYINVFVRQLGYSIINDVRVYLTKYAERSLLKIGGLGFFLDVGYKIHILNERYLSISFGRCEYFACAHPNHHLYSLNFALKPERKIKLYDIIDYGEYSNLEAFLVAMAVQYGEAEYMNFFKEFSKIEYSYELEFFFDQEIFTICYANLFHHVDQPHGYLEIPMEKIKFNI